MTSESSNPPGVGGGSVGRWEWLALAGILLLATLLRVYHLGYKSLWLDEVMMVRSAYGNGGLADPMGFAAVGHPPLYLVLLRLLMQLGQEDWLVRLPAALASLAAVVAIWALGRSMLGRAAGLAAAFIMAVSVFSVHYAQEAHNYALFILLNTLMLWLLFRAARRYVAGLGPAPGSPRGQAFRDWLATWGAFVLVSAANLYTHYYAVFPVAVSLVTFPALLLAAEAAPGLERAPGGRINWASLWRDPQRRRAILHLVAVLALLVLIFSPFLLFGLQGSLEHAADKAEAISSGAASVKFGFGPDLAIDTYLDFAVGLTRLPPDLPAAKIMLVPLALGSLWLLWRRRALAAGLFLWVLVPMPAIAWFAYRSGISFASRRLAFAYPVFILLLAVGILVLARLLAALWQRVVRRGDGRLVFASFCSLLLVLFGFLNVRPFTSYYVNPKQDWKTLARLLDTFAGPEDAVVLVPNTVRNLSWYYHGDFRYGNEDLLQQVQALCALGSDLFVAVADTGPGIPQDAAAWLYENTIEVPLKQLHLFYRNCRSGAWYGDGAAPLLRMADHPDLSFPRSQRALQEYIALAADAADEASQPEGQGQLPSPTPAPSSETAAVVKAPAPAQAPSPLLVPAAVPVPALADWLSEQAQAQPQDARAQLLLGVYLARTGQADEAIGYLEPALTGEPTAVDLPTLELAYLAWADALVSQGQAEAAQAALQQGLAAYPEAAGLEAGLARLAGDAGPDESQLQALLQAGHDALQEGQWDTALTAARAATTLAPQATEPYLLQGDVLQATDRLEKALDAYEHAARLAPQDGAAQARLASLFQQLERPQDAAAAALAAVVAGTDDSGAWLILGQAPEAQAGDTATGALAEAALQQAVTLASAGETAAPLALAEFYAAQQRPGDAIPLYQQVVDMRPDDASLQLAFAEVLRAAGQVDRAAEAYRAWTAANPDDQGSRLDLAAVLVQAGRQEEALAEYDAIIAAWPNNPWGYVGKGQALEAQGNFDQGIDWFQQAIDLEPDNATLRFLLGYAYRRNGMTQQAIAQFEAGLELDPTRDSARSVLDSLRQGNQ